MHSLGMSWIETRGIGPHVQGRSRAVAVNAARTAGRLYFYPRSVQSREWGEHSNADGAARPSATG